MATATLPLEWTGRSGRTYGPVTGASVRHGDLTIVRKVTARGPPTGASTVGEGVPLALKQCREGDDTALELLQVEADILVQLTRRDEGLPCPRLYDLVGDPVVTGLVMEWCPGDLERWWRDRLDGEDAFGRLMAVMAEVARRLGDYHGFHGDRSGVESAHGDLKPGNILLDDRGRWLLSDFGAAQVEPPRDSPWASSDVVRGTENFLAPEMLFHARTRHPAAVDTWALGAILFALLRLQRMVLDGESVPRNGTASARFRMTRVDQVLEVYRAEPTRFFGQDLEPDAFPQPLELPEADRRALRECVRGVFGDDARDKEHRLAEQLLELMDHAMSIDPAHRYTTARDLAAACEGLTREYIALSAGSPALLPDRGAPDETSAALRQEMARLEARLRAAEAKAPAEPASPAPRAGASPIVLVLLSAVLLLQVVLLIAVAGLFVAVLVVG